MYIKFHFYTSSLKFGYKVLYKIYFIDKLKKKRKKVTGKSTKIVLVLWNWILNDLLLKLNNINYLVINL
jgi:hypothetical protein